MNRAAILSAVLILCGSALSGCFSGTPSSKERYPLRTWEETVDPLAGRAEMLPWRPPRQLAAYVHPHEDRSQGILIGGHWVFLLLGDGGWYIEPEREKDPVPDAEAAPTEREAGVRALELPGDSVVPYAPPGGRKP
jgi:hypothetical protein